MLGEGSVYREYSKRASRGSERSNTAVLGNLGALLRANRIEISAGLARISRRTARHPVLPSQPTPPHPAIFPSNPSSTPPPSSARDDVFLNSNLVGSTLMLALTLSISSPFTARLSSHLRGWLQRHDWLRCLPAFGALRSLPDCRVRGALGERKARIMDRDDR